MNRPRLLSGLEFLWAAFWELTTERQIGMGVEGRIPGSKIIEFGKENGFSHDTLDWFRRVMREMDAEYLGIRNVSPSEVINEIPISDTQGIKNLLRRYAKPKPEAPAAATKSEGSDGEP